MLTLITRYYSTETTMISLHDHLTNAISHQQVSCLCLLDISAVFDKLDHSVLLHRLSTCFGISVSNPTKRRTRTSIVPQMINLPSVFIIAAELFFVVCHFTLNL